MFLSIIQAIKQEHIKFKTWIKTYGYNIDVMKFIKNINDENSKFMDGQYMDKIMTELFGNDRSLIKAPKINEADFDRYFKKLKCKVQSLSDIYLRSSLGSNHKSDRDSHKTFYSNKST